MMTSSKTGLVTGLGILAAAAYLTVGISTASASGGRGNDILLSGDGNDTPAVGGTGNDVLLGDRGNDRARRGGAGNDVLLGGRSNDVRLAQDGNDLLIINNGDGSDYKRAPRGPGRLTTRRVTDLEWRGMFVNPVGGWKGGGAGRWVFQGATLKIRDLIVRKAGKIPGDTRKVQVVNRLVRLSPPPKRTVIHSWISNILQKPGGPQGEIHDFSYKIPMNVKPGRYQICMVIDPGNKIKETKEDNNRYCDGPFWIRPRQRH